MQSQNESTEPKKLLSRLFLILAAIHLVFYAIYHASYVFILNEWSVIISYVYLYIGKAMNIVVPAVIATVALTVYAKRGRRSMILYTFVLSLSTLLHSIPYYYIICIAYGFDTYESLILLLPISLGIALLCFLLSIISALIGLLSFGKIEGKLTRRDMLDGELSTLPLLSGCSKVGKALIIPSFISFTVQLIRELTDALSFFIEADWEYELIDIAFIVLTLVFILIALVLSVLLCGITRKKILKRLI